MIDYETYVRIKNYFTRDYLKYSPTSNKLELDQRTVAIWTNKKDTGQEKQVRVKTSLIHLKTILSKC